MRKRILKAYHGVFDDALARDVEPSKEEIRRQVSRLYGEHERGMKVLRRLFQAEADRIFDTCIQALIKAMEFDPSDVKETYR